MTKTARKKVHNLGFFPTKEVEEIQRLNETLEKPSVGGKKCKKIKIPAKDEAPHGAQLKVGRRKKYATASKTVISDKKGRSKIV